MNQAQRKSEYYTRFDYLRIVLATAVMLYHDRVLSWAYSGNLAVQIFFALSGWLIGGILVKTTISDLPRFYLNRAVRIWIPYYTALVLLIVASLTKDHTSAKWSEFVFYKASFVYNVFGPPQIAEFRDQMPLKGTGNHFWSVNAEEQFYLLAPILLVVAAHTFGRKVIVWAALSATAWWFNVYASICFGVLAALINHNYGAVHSKPVSKAVLCIVAAAATFGLWMDYDYWRLSPPLAICVVLLLSKTGNHSALGKFLGGMSYPLYLNHWIGVFAANALLAPYGLRESPLRQALAATLNLLMAGILYWQIDKRLQSARDDIYTEFRGRLFMMLSYVMVVAGMVVGLIITKGMA